jgi:hypothetical protein
MSRETWASARRFAQCAHAMGRAIGEQRLLPDVAKEMFSGEARDRDLVEILTRTSVNAVDTTSDLYVAASAISYDFCRALEPLTILGRVPKYTNCPLQTALPFWLTGVVFDFFGDGELIPAAAPTSGSVYLEARDVGGLLVASKRQLRESQATDGIQRMSLDALASAIDRNLVDPALVADATRPGSITSTGTELSAAGVVDADGVDALCADLQSTVQVAGSNFARTAYLCSHRKALAISLLNNSAGARAFPGVTVSGGVLCGLPLVASGSCPDDILVIVDAGELLVGDNSEVFVDASENAIIDQSDGSPPVLVPMFSTESVSLRFVRRISWKMRRPDLCAYASSFNLPLPTLVTA